MNRLLGGAGDGRPTRAIGLMSGTSADGIDAALVSLAAQQDQLRITLEHSLTAAYPAEIRERILQACADRATTRGICLLNADLGSLFGEAAKRVAQEAGVAMETVDFIASHGQTIWHEPERADPNSPAGRGTLQIGEPCLIAEATGRTVVADFRPRDMAAGGQGAPLVPYVDHLLFSDPERTRAAQNVGGIGNVTYLPAGGGPDSVIAFDTGPGNALIDAAVVLATRGAATQDTDGAMARRGRVNDPLLAELLAHPYLSRPPPKSTGRELFGQGFVQSLEGRCASAEDLVATLAEFTAASISGSYADWLRPRGEIDEVILAGGGARNPALVEALRRRLAPVPLRFCEDFGFSSDAKEAVAFTVLGYETLRGRPSNLPSATGAARPVVLGKIIPGAS
jgi:anhydro-N-acetylmuramic acid kinase